MPAYPGYSKPLASPLNPGINPPKPKINLGLPQSPMSANMPLRTTTLEASNPWSVSSSPTGNQTGWQPTALTQAGSQATGATTPSLSRAITSAINPSNVFSPQQIAENSQSILTEGIIAANSAPKGSGLSGVASFSPAMQYQQAYQRANALGQAGAQAEAQRQSDLLTNAQSVLKGESARFADALGQMSADQSLNNLRVNQGNKSITGILDAINSMVGGTMGDIYGNIANSKDWAKLGTGNMALGLNNLIGALGLGSKALDTSLSDRGDMDYTGLLDAILYG
jgi:hypothetical protein